MSMGGFPEEKYKIEQKTGKAADLGGFDFFPPVCSKAVE